MRTAISRIQRWIEDLMASRRFADILNECLERVEAGEDVSRCAGAYPEHEEELLPLLTVAAATRAASDLPSSADAKTRIRLRFTQAVADAQPSQRGRIPARLRPMAKPLALAFVAVAVTAVAAGGTTLAASNSVPGEPLYWVKTTKESISIRFVPRSDISAANAYASLAEERGKEMRTLIERGNIAGAEKLGDRIRKHLNDSAARMGIVVPVNPREMPIVIRVRTTSGHPQELRSRLKLGGTRLRMGLSQLMQDLPPQHKQRIQHLMRESDLGYRLLLRALYTGDAPQTPLGVPIEPPNHRSR